jgi:polar amino acid transport system substrate-binding protein
LVFSLSADHPTIAGTLTEIQQRGKLIVGIKDNLPPLGFRDNQGNLQGLEIEIAKAIATNIFGNPQAIEFKPLTNQNRLQGVLNQEVDITIAKVTRNPSRSRVVEFSRPYYIDSTSLITKNTQFRNLESLQNQRVAVLNNSITIGTLQFILPNTELVGINSYQEGKSLLDQGQVVALAGDRTVFTDLVNQRVGYDFLAINLSRDPIAVVLPKGLQYDGLLRKVDQTIIDLEVNGWLRERLKYWKLE